MPPVEGDEYRPNCLQGRSRPTSRMAGWRGLLAAAHPAPSFAVTGFTTALAVGAGRGRRSLAVGAAALAGQLAVGWSNDFIDRDRDGSACRQDKPIVIGAAPPELVRNCAIAAAAACVPLSLLSGWRAGVVHFAAVSSAIGYNAGLKSTPFSVVPYAAAFGALPAFVALGGRPPERPSLAAVAAAALMGSGAHFINTVPDLERDAATGVRGLPHRLGRAPSVLAGATLLASSTAIVARAGDRPMGLTGRILVAASATAVAGVVVAESTGRERLAWDLSLATAAGTVLLYLSRHGSHRSPG